MPPASRTAAVRRESSDSSNAVQLLHAITLLLQDLNDTMQSSADAAANARNKADSIDDAPASVTGQLTPWGVQGPNGAPNANSIKCKSLFRKASAFSVQFGLDNLSGTPQASVSWTLGGNTITRVFDVTPGCSISGFAEQVNVTVIENSSYGTVPSAVPYNVTIIISPNTRARTAVPPVYTALLAKQVNAGASAATIAVPLGANGLNVNGVSSGAAAQIRVDIYTTGTIGENATKIGSYEIDTYNPGFIPFMAGAGQVVISNEGGSLALITAVFSIDG
jgi:hypothetical protein